MDDNLLPPHKRGHGSSPRLLSRTTVIRAEELMTGAQSPVQGTSLQSPMVPLQPIQSPVVHSLGFGFARNQMAKAQTTNAQSPHSTTGPGQPRSQFGQPTPTPVAGLVHPELLPPGSSAALEPVPVPVLAKRLPSAMLPAVVRQQEELTSQLQDRLRRAAVEDALARIGITQEQVDGDGDLAGVVSDAVASVFAAVASDAHLDYCSDPFVRDLARAIATALVRAGQEQGLVPTQPQQQAQQDGAADDKHGSAASSTVGSRRSRRTGSHEPAAGVLDATASPDNGRASPAQEGRSLRSPSRNGSVAASHAGSVGGSTAMTSPLAHSPGYGNGYGHSYGQGPASVTGTATTLAESTGLRLGSPSGRPPLPPGPLSPNGADRTPSALRDRARAVASVARAAAKEADEDSGFYAVPLDKHLASRSNSRAQSRAVSAANSTAQSLAASPVASRRLSDATPHGGAAGASAGTPAAGSAARGSRHSARHESSSLASPSSSEPIGLKSATSPLASTPAGRLQLGSPAGPQAAFEVQAASARSPSGRSVPAPAAADPLQPAQPAIAVAILSSSGPASPVPVPRPVPVVEQPAAEASVPVPDVHNATAETVSAPEPAQPQANPYDSQEAVVNAARALGATSPAALPAEARRGRLPTPSHE